MPQKDNILLLLFPGSRALPVTGTESMALQFILQLNISFTNISVYGRTFGQLLPKCSAVIQRCFNLCSVSNCERGFHTVGNTGKYCQLHSHEYTPFRSFLSPHLAPSHSFYVLTGLLHASAFYLLAFSGNELLSTVIGLWPRIHFQQVSCFRMSSLTETHQHNEYKDRHSLPILFVFLKNIFLFDYCVHIIDSKQHGKHRSAYVEINIELKHSPLMNKRKKKTNLGKGATGAAGFYSQLMKVMLHGRIQ